MIPTATTGVGPIHVLTLDPTGWRHLGARGCARLRLARWQRGGQRNQRRNRAAACAEVRTVNLGTMTSLPAHLGRSSHEVSRRKVGRIAKAKRAVRALAARRNHQAAPGKFLKFVLKRTLPLVEDVETVPWSRSPTIQPLWVQPTAKESFSCGSNRPHFAGNVRASVRVSDIEKEGSCPTACATPPMLIDRDRSFRNWSIYENRSPRRVGPHGPAPASMGSNILSLLTQGEVCVWWCVLCCASLAIEW